MESQIKGNQYELQILHHINDVIKKPAYLWNQIPEDILNKYGLKTQQKHNPDTGIDIIQIDTDTEITLIQCKNGYKKGLKISDLAGFYSWKAHFPQYNGIIYYTDKLSKTITSMPQNPKITYIKHEFVSELSTESPHKFIIDPVKLEYQTKIYKIALKYYETNNHGYLDMPCATGKTYISYLLSSHFKLVVILCPYLEYARITMQKFVDYGWNSNKLLIDDTLILDDNSIKITLKTSKFLICTTYNNIGIINYLVRSTIRDTLLICDDYHYHYIKSLHYKIHKFHLLENTELKILFMSSSQQMYWPNLDDTKFKKIFGDNIYKMTYSKAIRNKYISNYNIHIPNHDIINLLLTHFGLSSDYDTLVFLITSLINTNSKKCLAFYENPSIDAKESAMKLMINKINEIDKYFCLNINCSIITTDDDSKDIATKLNNFYNSKHIELLFTDNILSECIDCKGCDSIFFIDCPYPEEHIMQKIGRTLLLDKNNPQKEGNIFVWDNEGGIAVLKKKIIPYIEDIDCDFPEVKKDKTIITLKENEINKELKYIHYGNYLITDNWNSNLNIIQNIIDKNGIKSLCIKENKVKIDWIVQQHKNYSANEYNMKISNFRDIWEGFIVNLTDEEITKFITYVDDLESKLSIKKAKAPKKKSYESVELICKYCKNYYSDATTLSKHINYYCKFIPDDIKAKIIEKQMNRKKYSRKS